MAKLGELTALESLSLQNISITDTLVLDRTGITDLGLKELSVLRNLKRLFVRGTSTSEEGREALQALLPGLKIVA